MSASPALPTERKRPWLLPAFLLAGWIALALSGFPAPTIDDLFYAGPAVHLAAGEGLVNPWLGVLDPVGHRFLVYPPLYFPLLAGWLKGFGVGTLSLLAFQACAAFLAAIVGLAFLRRIEGRPPLLWPCLAGNLLLATLVALSGLRPDVCALALFALGAWIETEAALPFPRFRIPLRFLGPLLLVASVQTLPFLVVWASLFFLWRFLTTPDGGRGDLIARFGLAFTLNVFLFLWAIGFRLPAFLHDLAVCQANHSFANRAFYADTWHSPAYLLRTLLLPLCFLGSGAVVLGGKWRRAVAKKERRALARTASLLVLLVVLSLVFLTRSVSSVRFLGLQCAAGTVLFAWIAALGLREGKAIPARWIPPALAVVAVLFFVVSYGRGLVEWASVARPDAGEIARLRTEADARLAQAPGAPFLVDPVSARVIFDFRLPSGARDATWEIVWTHPPLAPGPESERIAPAFALFSPQKTLYAGFPDGDRRYAPHLAVPIQLFGREIPRTAANRNAIFFVPTKPDGSVW
ncbi:hypothetical protein SAMN05444156_0130 [Verrucomicrobium sp. GAS474]|uniref:hypothetical protein n=1 Tax=Verrucomicrobium sp. GAS474 TaxID=1882831 RepID=UPI00087BDBD4|nr:hypothetical protein [Verrucomicrobium sp. GAS474]SDT86114.1 hypothetical protein SAMN05444156_0130 [Verrucomicrobium sp. GAS474]